MSKAAPLSMTLTNREIRGPARQGGPGFGFNVSCPGVENLHSGSPTTSRVPESCSVFGPPMVSRRGDVVITTTH